MLPQVTEELLRLGAAAKTAVKTLSVSDTQTRNTALTLIADALVSRGGEILSANALDMDAGRKNGTTAALLDRLELTKKRLEGIADGVRQVAQLDDPLGS
ncbi:MAG: gamma-glutamyl-phosphate reductase, partial [Oscillospiraceae bacterium]|nr:gamma-glutamyl-phosphate reductase [Oscillospiraceae bacterium]